MTEEITEQLLRYKKEIEENKLQKASLEGKQEELLNKLKEDFNLNSIEEAEKELDRLQQEIEKEETKLGEDFNQFKEEYNAV